MLKIVCFHSNIIILPSKVLFLKCEHQFLCFAIYLENYEIQLGQHARSPYRFFNGQRCQICLRSDSLQQVMERLATPVNDYAVTISPDQSKDSVDDVALPVVPEWKHDSETKSKGNRNVSETDGALSSDEVSAN
ncbi:unnamed protein product [Fraxinus pennsylvanica]|uniref:Uncharacterized protein n=1 Tax=Fraxinus pennsylvanica TaxID=56036 RepID=A0AAD2DV17_9LAMI|nr:unnamed protein product [Fraxinus pennsylvanica]